MKHCCWLILLFTYSELLAQQAIYSKFQQFDVENGLPQNLVSDIVQDDDGFIWVSTIDGIARYDGNRFLIIQHQATSNKSISSNSINSLLKDRYNNIWIAYVNPDLGNSKLNPRTFEISKAKKISFPHGNLMPGDPYQLPSRHFWGDEKNWVYLYYESNTNTVQVELLDATNIKFKNFLVSNTQLSNKRIYAFSEAEDGKLWLVTEQGLEVSDDRWANFKRINFPAQLQLDSESLPSRVKLFHLSKNRVVILEGNKVVIYKVENGNFETIQTPDIPNKSPKFSATTIDSQGRLVFEFQGNIYRLEDNNSLSLIWKHPYNYPIRCILIDHSNTLWIGTDTDGLFKVDLLSPKFESHPYKNDFITDVLFDEIKINTKKSRTSFVPQNVYLSRYLYTDKGTLILFHVGGLFEATISKINNRSLEMVHQGGYGVIAAGSNNSVLLLEFPSKNNDILYQWSDFSKPPITVKPELDSGMFLTYNSDNYIVDMLGDGDQYWVATNGKKIYQFRGTKHTKTITLKDNYAINDISFDPKQKNILWIGTISGGLFKWDIDTNKKLVHYTTENGLPNNTINSIVPDSLGYLWMSTNKGIARFNPIKETFTNYTTEDGLYESEFNRHHDLLLPDGRIAMGSTRGYSVFNPNRFSEDTFTPKVFITKVTVNEKSVDHRVDSIILPDPVNQLEQIDLTYENNSIGFEIAALQFNAPEKIKYRYMLERYDKNWVDTERGRPIRFNQLPSGNYTLLLNASNTLGTWSPSIRKLGIVVHPPLWFTWWAYLIYATLFGIMIAFYWRIYKNRLVAKQEAAFNIRETARLRDLNETKTRFFSNITHEFRTPLTLILSPLEKHLKDIHIPSITAHTLLNNNYRHANQLLKLVNQLLDIAKLEAGQMRINPTTGDIIDFVEQCVSSFQVQANEKNIALTLSNANISGNYLFDHEKWEKILFNLLSNAIKFTPAYGKVEVSISSERKNPNQPLYIKIQIQDSGVGLDEDELPKIFERFYQVDDSATRTHEGTGIGLSLVKELVNLMGGTIHVSSAKDRGTSFTLEITIEQLKEIPSAREVTSINNFQIKDEEAVPGVDHEVPVILVVEDNEELRSFIKESLHANWNVLEASNGLDGWTIIERELPEIVISDVMMPGMSGFELCSKAKKDPRTSHINFIMLTAKAAQESKIEGLESGADDYLTKPFHLYELELRIRNLLLEQHSLRKHLKEKLLPLKPALELPHVSDVFMTRLQAYIESNIDNTQLQVETVAEAMAMSRSTLNRKMKVLLNISIHDYVKKYRLQKAAVLLSSGHSVTDVTFRVGFESPSYFAQCFKEHFRQTPSEFSKVRG